jgi:hypothetical protein
LENLAKVIFLVGLKNTGRMGRKPYDSSPITYLILVRLITPEDSMTQLQLVR